MIIQVLGSNGSGKTTAVRAVITHLTEIGKLLMGGKEYGTFYSPAYETRPLLVMGKYGEAATGGCDRISDVKSVRPVIREQHVAAGVVLLEGIRMMNHTDGCEFAGRYGPEKFALVLLTSDLATCLGGISARQAAAGRDKPVVVGDINSTRANNYAAKMRQLGVKLVRASREDAPAEIMKLLGRA